MTTELKRPVVRRTATAQESDTIAAIATRYWEMCLQNNRVPIASRFTLAMDIEGVHCNGCPLRLDALLNASGGDFLHDVVGIVMNIDRQTGQLSGLFSPRFIA